MVNLNYVNDLNNIEQIAPNKYRIKKGFVNNMKVEGIIYVNEKLKEHAFEELHEYYKSSCKFSFLPALKQVANVASLPGIVKYSIGLPDIHSGYGFAIGNVAAFDMQDPAATVCPGGVGFDINCGVRVIRTNLMEADIADLNFKLANSLFKNIPAGIGTQGLLSCDNTELVNVLQNGIDWSIEKGHAWSEDKEHCEEKGRMMNANPEAVSKRALKRGLKQLGSLGAGNHYAEVQVVSKIFDIEKAKGMGIEEEGQVCVMIHSGSRGLGHQVATDSIISINKYLNETKIELNDKQLAAANINSKEGQNYLQAMASAANYAWVNRSTMTNTVRKIFSETFNQSADDLEMSLIYDVSHNIAKVEEHFIDGKPTNLLLHRKGATRAFPPNHPMIPLDYQSIGQPVLIGGTMGTYSYILTGTEKGFSETFGSTCHGAGRYCSRNKCRKTFNSDDILKHLEEKGIAVCVLSPNLIMEEAPDSYKDVSEVVQTCHDVGISNKCVQLRPVAVIKG